LHERLPRHGHNRNTCQVDTESTPQTAGEEVEKRFCPLTYRFCEDQKIAIAITSILVTKESFGITHTLMAGCNRSQARGDWEDIRIKTMIAPCGAERSLGRALSIERLSLEQIDDEVI